jgi:hypothetical protein
MTRLKSAACFAVATGATLLAVVLHIIPALAGVWCVAIIWGLFWIAAATR